MKCVQRQLIEKGVIEDLKNFPEHIIIEELDRRHFRVTNNLSTDLRMLDYAISVERLKAKNTI